jgi:hypothetical protein
MLQWRELSWSVPSNGLFFVGGRNRHNFLRFFEKKMHCPSIHGKQHRAREKDASRLFDLVISRQHS